MSENPHGTTILTAHTPALFDAAVRRAAELLKSGEVVALPTETVYGLAANALNETAVKRIYAIKGRPSHNPIIVHVTDSAMARVCASDWPPLAQKLAAAFWPGPLTMVLPRGRDIPDSVTAGGATVGLRAPSHPIMQAIIRACGFPLAAPSANLANQLSPTSAQHVFQALKGRVPLIIDGGQSQVGIESTVIDLTVTPPRVLRPGMIHEQSLVSVAGPVQVGTSQAEGTLRSPGMLRKHYAPKARLVVLSWQDEHDLRRQLAGLGASAETFIIAHTHVPVSADGHRTSIIPHDPEAFARAIYSELHRCDSEGAELIVVEAVPNTPEWHGIADRLNRAAAS